MFRPIGLLTFAELAVELSKDMPLSVAVRQLGRLPRQLRTAPVRDVLWDPRSKVVLPKNRAFLRKVFLVMLGRAARTRKLMHRYHQLTGKMFLPHV